MKYSTNGMAGRSVTPRMKPSMGRMEKAGKKVAPRTTAAPMSSKRRRAVAAIRAGR